jgi:glutathione S-transferase
VEAALRLKGIEYRRVEFLPMSQILIGPLLWSGTTVPGLRLKGKRMVGSRPIMRKLDELVGEPALLPDDPQARARVVEAESWGHDVLQDVPRRIIDAGFLRDPYAMGGYAQGAKMPVPVALMRPAMPLTARLMARRNHAQDEPARADVAALPEMLDRIDAWIADGVLGADQPNAADLQIGSSIRLLQTIGDIRPLIETRPAASLTRYFWPQPGEVAAGTLPGEWLAHAPAPHPS